MTNFCARLCNYGEIVVSPSEEIHLSKIDSTFTKKYLVQRKTICKLALFFYFLGCIINTIVFFAVDHTDDYPIQYYFNICLIGYLYIQFGLLFVMCYDWNEFRISSSFSKMLGFMIIYLPLLLLYIPYIALIEEDLFIALPFILYEISQFLTPPLLLLQTVLFRSNSLSNKFKTESKFKLISSVLLKIYICIVWIIFGILYQITQDFVIVLFVFSYTLSLSIDTEKNKFGFKTRSDYIVLVLNYVFTITSLFSAIFIFYTYFGINLVRLTISGYIQYCLMSIIVDDSIMNLIIEDSIIDSNRVASTLNNIDSFVIDITERKEKLLGEEIKEVNDVENKDVEMGVIINL